jgi:hypothetical protein
MNWLYCIIAAIAAGYTAIGFILYFVCAMPLSGGFKWYDFVKVVTQWPWVF